jgi:hypothetical protein
MPPAGAAAGWNGGDRCLGEGDRQASLGGGTNSGKEELGCGGRAWGRDLLRQPAGKSLAGFGGEVKLGRVRAGVALHMALACGITHACAAKSRLLLAGAAERGQDSPPNVRLRTPRLPEAPIPWFHRVLVCC